MPSSGSRLLEERLFCTRIWKEAIPSCTVWLPCYWYSIKWWWCLLSSTVLRWKETARRVRVSVWMSVMMTVSVSLILSCVLLWAASHSSCLVINIPRFAFNHVILLFNTMMFYDIICSVCHATSLNTGNTFLKEIIRSEKWEDWWKAIYPATNTNVFLVLMYS